MKIKSNVDEIHIVTCTVFDISFRILGTYTKLSNLCNTNYAAIDYSPGSTEHSLFGFIKLPIIKVLADGAIVWEDTEHPAHLLADVTELDSIDFETTSEIIWGDILLIDPI